MKIVFDSQSSADVEQHARFMHREMMKQKNLPRVAAATRALIPGWCDDCGERAWAPVMGGLCFCNECWKQKQGKPAPGF